MSQLDPTNQSNQPTNQHWNAGEEKTKVSTIWCEKGNIHHHHHRRMLADTKMRNESYHYLECTSGKCSPSYLADGNNFTNSSDILHNPLCSLQHNILWQLALSGALHITMCHYRSGTHFFIFSSSQGHNSHPKLLQHNQCISGQLTQCMQLMHQLNATIIILWRSLPTSPDVQPCL